jgi:hypothetical protein
MSVKKSINQSFQGLKSYFLKSRVVTRWRYVSYFLKGIDNTIKKVYNRNKQLFIGTKMSKRPTKNHIYTHETHAVNNETGEVIASSKETIIQFPAEPEYIKLYLDDINRIYELPNNSILYEIMKRMDYDGLINLSKYAKDMICEKLDLKPQTFANYLQILKKKDIIKAVGTGTFMPNPNLFGKGSWKDIYNRRKTYESIKFQITYKADGSKTVQTEFELNE